MKIFTREVSDLGAIFSKPSVPSAPEAPTPAASPAPAVEGATKEERNTSNKKKRNNKASLMVSNTANGSGGISSGINL